MLEVVPTTTVVLRPTTIPLVFKFANVMLLLFKVRINVDVHSIPYVIGNNDIRCYHYFLLLVDYDVVTDFFVLSCGYLWELVHSLLCPRSYTCFRQSSYLLSRFYLSITGTCVIFCCRVLPLCLSFFCSFLHPLFLFLTFCVLSCTGIFFAFSMALLSCSGCGRSCFPKQAAFVSDPLQTSTYPTTSSWLLLSLRFIFHRNFNNSNSSNQKRSVVQTTKKTLLYSFVNYCAIDNMYIFTSNKFWRGHPITKNSHWEEQNFSAHACAPCAPHLAPTYCSGWQVTVSEEWDNQSIRKITLIFLSLCRPSQRCDSTSGTFIIQTKSKNKKEKALFWNLWTEMNYMASCRVMRWWFELWLLCVVATIYIYHNAGDLSLGHTHDNAAVSFRHVLDLCVSHLASHQSHGY